MKKLLFVFVSLVTITACGEKYEAVYYDRLAVTVNSFSASRPSVADGESVTFSWEGSGIFNAIISINNTNSIETAARFASKNNVSNGSADSVTCTRSGTILSCGSYGNADISSFIGNTPNYIFITASAPGSSTYSSNSYTTYIQVAFPQ